jgi:hypothetical protein
MVGEYVLSTPHNYSLTPEFATSFCLSYVAAQKASVAPKVSATRQVIQTNGSHLVQVLLPRLKELEQSCHNLFVLSTWKNNTPCWRGGRRLLHHKLLRHQILMSQEYMYIKKTHNFPLISLWNANFKCMKWCKSL